MPHHPQTNRLVERSCTRQLCTWLGSWEKTRKLTGHLIWLKYCMPIMPPNQQLPGIIHTIWCLDDGLGSWSTFVFPTIGSNEAPMREAFAKHVDVYIASVTGYIEDHPTGGAQAQSTAEACWQKRYFDRKIGAVNLKAWWPGTSECADAWKGKRKIKDRWEEETWELVHQIMADIPSYKVTNQCGWSQSPPLKLTSHHIRDWHSLGVWAAVIHRTGVPAPPHARLPP